MLTIKNHASSCDVAKKTPRMHSDVAPPQVVARPSRPTRSTCSLGAVRSCLLDQTTGGKWTVARKSAIRAESALACLVPRKPCGFEGGIQPLDRPPLLAEPMPARRRKPHLPPARSDSSLRCSPDGRRSRATDTVVFRTVRRLDMEARSGAGRRRSGNGGREN
jgi:hypothetical protein